MPHERGEASLLVTLKAKRCRGHLRTGSDHISDLNWSHLVVDPAELPEIAVDCDVAALIRMVSPHPSPRGKASVKTNDWTETVFFSVIDQNVFEMTKKISHFGHNVWKCRLMNTVMASFHTTAKQMTKMSQQKNWQNLQPSRPRWDLKPFETTINEN